MTMAERKDYVGRAKEFARKVVGGEIPSFELVVLACSRFLSDLDRSDIYLDEKAARRVCSFLESLKHYKGALAGKKLRLEDWQVFIFVNLFGWKVKATGLRRFRYGDVLVPRKNGKTMIASGVALYLEFMDGEAGAEVYAAAVDKEQARICFNGSKELLKGSIIEDVAKVVQNEISFPDGACTYKPLSKDTRNKDGLNPHGAVCDERHAWSTNEIYELIVTGMGARTQPLVFSISTAGMDTSLPYYQDVQVLQDVLRGIKEKDDHFILLYIPDQGARWDDPEVWRKANPNFGVSVGADYMQSRYEEAKLKGGATQASFCVKNLNMWVDAPEVWIPDDDVWANNADFDESTLKGEDCYVGLDLASKADISAVCLFFPKYMVAKFLFVIPETKVAEKEDRVDYRRWVEQGWVTATPGNVLDEDWFVSFLLGQLEPYKVQSLAYDPWAIWNILPKLRKYEDQLMEYQQSIRYMSVPTKWIQAEVLQHHLNLLRNPVIRWMFKNVVIYTDPNANIKLDKARARNKIDGVVAMADAVGGWLNLTAGEKKEIYTEHTLRVINLDEE